MAWGADRCIEVGHADGQHAHARVPCMEVRMEPGVMQQADGHVPVVLLCVGSSDLTESIDRTPSASPCAHGVWRTKQGQEQAMDRGLAALHAVSAPHEDWYGGHAAAVEDSGMESTTVESWTAHPEGRQRGNGEEDKVDASRAQTGRALDRKRLNRLMRRLAISSQ